MNLVGHTQYYYTTRAVQNIVSSLPSTGLLIDLRHLLYLLKHIVNFVLNISRNLRSFLMVLHSFAHLFCQSVSQSFKCFHTQRTQT